MMSSKEAVLRWMDDWANVMASELRVARGMVEMTPAAELVAI